MTLWRVIADRIGEVTGDSIGPGGADSVGGGCINRAVRLAGAERDYFVKLNAGARLDMFEAEAAGLQEIARSGSLRVPRPLCWGVHGDSAYLVLEHVEFGRGGTSGLEALGRGLAAMHRVTRDRFGWERDNTIGSTPQINTSDRDWTAFWRERRLGYQLELAARNGYGGSLQRGGERLMDALPALFDDYRPAPSLLHGDLWSGNYAMDSAGDPVIFDPAVYYGDRETDLAMTELFGGFGGRFYAAYREAWPLEPGYQVRKRLYNLYHILNHANLFGGGYASQARHLIDGLLSELR
ncbi:MAG TPA: fructosamine kinase family protein [Gammaproteobacteria bacterium]|nr:fructosamine kinase family protein [Gammaproteobacteria bacterium]